MYGIETWWNTRGAKTALKPLSVSYHYAIKKIIGLPKRVSNHYACYLLDRLVFNHFIVYEMAKFNMWIRRTNSPCLVPYKHYMLNRSSFKLSLDNIFVQNYGFENFENNDLDAIKSRIFYIQNREDSSWDRERYID